MLLIKSSPVRYKFCKGKKSLPSHIGYLWQDPHNTDWMLPDHHCYFMWQGYLQILFLEVLIQRGNLNCALLRKSQMPFRCACLRRRARKLGLMAVLTCTQVWKDFREGTMQRGVYRWLSCHEFSCLKCCFPNSFCFLCLHFRSTSPCRKWCPSCKPAFVTSYISC